MVVGTGVPSLSADSAAGFLVKMDASEMMLSIEDVLDDQVVDKFVDMMREGSGEAIDSSVASEHVQSSLKWLMDYTGGHAYPLMKLAEYLVVALKQKAMDNNNLLSDDWLEDKFYASIVCSESFRQTDTHSQLLNRSFSFEPMAFDHAEEIFSSPILISSKHAIFEKMSFWDSNRSWFLSNLLVYYLFAQRTHTIHPDFAKGSKLELLKHSLAVGLRGLMNGHFKQFDEHGFVIKRYENAIGHFFASIDQLFVSPQHKVTGRQDLPVTRGQKLTIDYYINGKIDTYVELMRDGSAGDLEKHADKFELKGVVARKKRDNNSPIVFKAAGAYNHVHQDNCVLLNIMSVGSPVEMPVNYEGVRHRCYTFVKDHNALYKGSTLLRRNVSQYLPQTPADFTKKSYNTMSVKFAGVANGNMVASAGRFFMRSAVTFCK